MRWGNAGQRQIWADVVTCRADGIAERMVADGWAVNAGRYEPPDYRFEEAAARR